MSFSHSPTARKPHTSTLWRVNVFLKRRSHNFMAWSMSKFWAAYKLPPSHPESIHPAFLNAMCLYGCSYGPSSTRVYEPLFYARLQRSLADCLASADRLHDFMRASALAAVYCFHRKRYAVGQNHLAATIHLAVACGLDKIDSCDVSSASISRLLRSPRDATDLGDMIHTWWGLFCMDRIASTLLECPTTIPENDDVITTIWPCKFEDYASGQAIHAAYSGTASLRTPPGDLTIAVSVYENVYAFRAKSVGLLFHTMTLTPSHQERNVDQIRDTRITIDVASRLSEIMVAYRQEMCPTFSCTRYCENDGHDSTLIFAMTTCYTALIRLLTVSADKDQGSYQRRLKIARDCVALGAEAYSTDPHLAAPCIVFAWCASYEVFAWEVVRLNKLGEGEAATAALLEVEAAMNLIRRLVQIFETFKKKWPVQNLQRFNIHKAELAKWSKH
ncbi:hypothetical protein BOTBODRAFT_28489 [Botryobasidium botryosum FD-172 SS1]|uniref:Xylanolytic transcriptional activator regulatory domain-containing protein n=1 Tax=Botryobasidium botryosum (strain FD-172 SS1) TaxID=930990 RepID=A0A067N5F8_BOTB1|nr:hypothetical protein BOTBODRAFT_28489 [Botryobasidium botryosum FD-172 SS1]